MNELLKLLFCKCNFAILRNIYSLFLYNVKTNLYKLSMNSITKNTVTDSYSQNFFLQMSNNKKNYEPNELQQNSI